MWWMQKEGRYVKGKPINRITLYSVHAPGVEVPVAKLKVQKVLQTLTLQKSIQFKVYHTYPI